MLHGHNAVFVVFFFLRYYLIDVNSYRDIVSHFCVSFRNSLTRYYRVDTVLFEIHGNYWRHLVSKCLLIIFQGKANQMILLCTWFIQVWSGVGQFTNKFSLTIDLIHKSQNAPVPYPTMPHSEQKCAHFCSEWSIVGYGTDAFWDLWNWSFEMWCK